MNWPTLRDVLRAVGRRRPVVPQSFFSEIARQKHVLQKLVEAESHAVPLISIADLFAGIAGFSRNKYHSYRAWRSETQGSLFSVATRKESTVVVADLSGGDRVRFPLVDRIYDRAGDAKLSVSISDGGLRTMRPSSALNFWWYVPQRIGDKAPTKPRDGALTS